MSNPTHDWERVSDRFYRKVKLYDAVFDQDLELENYTIAAAPYSGAVALHRDESKVYSYRGGQAAKAGIDLYSCSGQLISRLNWDKGAIRGLGWSEDEKLLVVTEDGSVRCYYDLHGEFTQFSLGSEAEDFGVKSCRFWYGGFVALLSNNHLISISSYTEPRPKLLAIPPENETVHSWGVIAPAYTLSRTVEVLLAIGQTIYVVDASESEDRLLQNGPFKHVSISPNGRFVALYTEDAKIWVISSDFQNKLSEYDSKARTMPKDVQWCGNNSVVLAWEDEVHMLGPNGAALKYYYDGWVHILPDVDGVRLITNDVCEFLQKVPEDSEEVFRPGSNAPASVLLDAAEQLDKKSPKADDNIQLIKPNLDEAIDMCVRAAGQEYSSNWQKQLLKAASFGKSVLDLYNSDDFVNMCETLRVLNAVRDYKIGMPLSYDQYLRLTPAKLVQRLVHRHEYLLAIRISEYLYLSTDQIYIHWASHKVRNSTESEESICNAVIERLKDKRGISYETIARAAYDEGRGNLATKLLDHEPRAGKQVPLLMSMEEDEIALDKAIESGDTDLVFYVLLQLKNKLPLASFFRTLSSRPLASALVESSAASNDSALLKDLYYQDDRPLDSSNLLFKDALEQLSVQQAIEKLRTAAKALSDSKDPTATHHQKAITEAQQLLRAQEALQRDNDTSYIGLSLHETLHTLIRSGYSKRAAKIQSDFHVPDKIYAWIRLRALVAARNWGELEELSKSRRSPINWEPYYNEILAAGRTQLAGVFVAKCTAQTPQDRSEMYVKCGMIAEAGKELAKAKDVDGLELLRGKTSDRNAQMEIERLVGQLRPKR
jgi:hypothetical protein